MELMNDRRVVIMRGISGSGKSTYAKTNFPGAVICSADHYFMRDGEYHWDRDKLGDAHGQCFGRFKQSLIDGAPLIVIDNTNIRRREVARYFDEATQFGYSVSVIRVTCDPALAALRNVHAVPAEMVEAMQARFEDWPGEELI